MRYAQCRNIHLPGRLWPVLTPAYPATYAQQGYAMATPSAACDIRSRRNRIIPRHFKPLSGTGLLPVRLSTSRSPPRRDGRHRRPITAQTHNNGDVQGSGLRRRVW